MIESARITIKVGKKEFLKFKPFMTDSDNKHVTSFDEMGHVRIEGTTGAITISMVCDEE